MEKVESKATEDYNSVCLNPKMVDQMTHIWPKPVFRSTFWHFKTRLHPENLTIWRAYNTNQEKQLHQAGNAKCISLMRQSYVAVSSNRLPRHWPATFGVWYWDHGRPGRSHHQTLLGGPRLFVWNQGLFRAARAAPLPPLLRQSHPEA